MADIIGYSTIDRYKTYTVTDFEIIKQDPKTSFNRALTDAQLSIKANPKTQHPFYWAPYNIYGNF